MDTRAPVLVGGGTPILGHPHRNVLVPAPMPSRAATDGHGTGSWHTWPTPASASPSSWVAGPPTRRSNRPGQADGGIARLPLIAACSRWTSCSTGLGVRSGRTGAGGMSTHSSR